MSYKEYKEETTRIFNEEREAVEQVKNLTDNVKEKMMKSLSYAFKEGNEWKMSLNRLNIDLRAYRLLNETYRVGIALSDEYAERGIIAQEQDERNDYIRMPLLHDGKRLKEAIEAIEKTIDEKEKQHKITELNAEFPWIKEAIEFIGIEEIKAKKYNKYNIEYAVSIAKSKQSLSDLDTTIAQLLRSHVTVGEKIERKKITNILNSIYADLDIKKIAKSTDVERYYECKLVSLREGYKINKAYHIFKSKFNF